MLFAIFKRKWPQDNFIFILSNIKKQKKNFKGGRKKYYMNSSLKWGDLQMKTDGFGARSNHST